MDITCLELLDGVFSIFFTILLLYTTYKAFRKFANQNKKSIGDVTAQDLTKATQEGSADRGIKHKADISTPNIQRRTPRNRVDDNRIGSEDEATEDTNSLNPDSINDLFLKTAELAQRRRKAGQTRKAFPCQSKDSETNEAQTQPPPRIPANGEEISSESPTISGPDNTDTATMSEFSTPVVDYTYRDLLPLHLDFLKDNSGPTISGHSYPRCSTYSKDTICSHDDLRDWIVNMRDNIPHNRIPLYSISNPYFKPLCRTDTLARSDVFPASPITTRLSVLSNHTTVAMDTDDAKLMTLSDYIRRNSFTSAPIPEDAFETTVRIGPLGGVAGIGGSILRVPHDGNKEGNVKIALWFRNGSDLGDRMLVTPTMRVERDCDVTDKPVRISLPTCYCANEEAKISVEWSSDGWTWRHLTEVSNNNSRFVEFETIMNCRFRATIPKDPELTFVKFMTSVAFAQNTESEVSFTKLTWCLCDASGYSEARVWLHMSPRGVYERVVEAKTFAIQQSDVIKVQLVDKEQEIEGKDLWPSQTFNKYSFQLDSSIRNAPYNIARNDDVIITSNVWLDTTDDCPETSSLLERQIGEESVEDHSTHSGERSKVRRAKTLAGHGLRKLVRKVRKRKTSFI